jgi:hypothetical protein
MGCSPTNPHHLGGIEMTQEQKRIKLAEAAGWKPDDDGAGLNTWEASYCGSRLYGLKPRFGAEGIVVSYIVDCLVPDYFNDLNAVHELEQQTWSKKWNLRDDFCDHLALIIDPVHGYTGLTVNDALQATSAQRSEALGLTLNLW